MADLTFHAGGDGHVYMDDGPWSVRLTEAQCNQLLDIWEGANAIRAHTSLYDACQKVGHIPRTTSARRLKLVTANA